MDAYEEDPTENEGYLRICVFVKWVQELEQVELKTKRIQPQKCHQTNQNWKKDGPDIYKF